MEENALKDSWEVHFSKVELVKELGRGAFGKVWKGVLTTSEFVKLADDNKRKKAKKKKNKKNSDESEIVTKTIEKKTTVAVKMLRGKSVLWYVTTTYKLYIPLL